MQNSSNSDSVSIANEMVSYLKDVISKVSTSRGPLLSNNSRLFIFRRIKKMSRLLSDTSLALKSLHPLGDLDICLEEFADTSINADGLALV